MNYQELEQRIRELSEIEDEDGKEMFDAKTLQNEDLMKMMQPELIKEFENVRHSKQKWHQFVRQIFWPDEELKFLKEDLCKMVINYRNSYTDYFMLRKNKKIYALPDRVTELSRLIILHEKFYKIYKNIVQNIHFENPINENYSKNANGKINWEKTLQMSKTEFPTYFYSQTWERKFHNPGNVLLILCIKWQHALAHRILHIEFSKELTKKELEILNQILIKTKKSVGEFPFYEVIRESNKYEHLDKDHKTIQKLQNELRKEIKQKIIKNYEYQKLLEWIEEFQTLDLSGLNKFTSNFILELQKDIDLAYEGWVFWKLVSIFYDKHFLRELVINEKEHYFEFIHDKKEIRVYHEREMKGYAKIHDPDYSVFIKPYTHEDLLCIFDAKNTPKLKGEMKDKIGSYKENLQCKIGGLIFNAKESQKDVDLYSTKDFFSDSEKIEKRKLDVDRKTWYYALRAKPDSDEKNKLVLNKMHEEIISEIEAIQ